MTIVLPECPDARPDAASLRKVLGYNLQQRNVISKALRNSFPGQWPDGGLPEASFYEALYGLMENHELCHKVLHDLLDLGMRKGNKWADALDLPERILQQARSLLSDPAAVVAVLAPYDDAEDPLAIASVYQQLTREGHPEFAWWASWVTSAFLSKMEGASGTEPERGFVDPEVLAVDLRMLEDELRATLLEVGHSPTETAEVSSSANLVGWFKSATQQFAELARCYEELTNQAGSTQRFNDALDKIEMVNVPEVTDLISRAREAMTGAVWPGQMLDGWAKRLERTSKALRNVQVLEIEHKASIQSALSKGDYAGCSLHLQKAASAHAELDALCADVAALVSELQISGHKQDEGSDLTTLAPAATEEREKLEKYEGVVPCAPTETHMESADTREDSAVAQDLRGEIVSIDNDDTPGLDDCQVSYQTGIVLPDLTTGVLQEASVKPKIGAKAATLTGRESTLSRSQTEDEAARDGDLPQWSAQVTVQQVAQAVLNCEEAQRAQTARTLAWALIRDGRIPLAYHIARVTAEVSPPKLGDIRPEPLRAIHLGGYLTSSSGEELVEIGEILQRFYEVDLADRALRGQRHLVLLTFAAVLRPALVARHASGADDLLRGLPLDETLSALHALREQILAPNFRYQAMLHLEPGSYLDDLRSRARQWWETNRRHTFKYEPTNRVWQHLLAKEQMLGCVLSIIVDGGPAKLEQAKGLLQAIESRTALEKMINQADQAVRDRKATIKPIEVGPLRDMVKRSTELIGYLAKWVEMIGEHSESSQAPGREADLRSDKERLLANIDRALVQLDSLQKSADLVGFAAAVCLKAVLSDVRGQLNGIVAGYKTHSAWWRTLNGVLLPSEFFVLVGDLWEPVQVRVPDPLVVLAELVNPSGWEASFDAANKRCDHSRTAQILDWLRYEDKVDTLMEALERRREEGLRRCRKELEMDLDATRNEVERAASLGYLGEEDRSRLVAILEATSTQSRENPGRAMTHVRDVQNELGQIRDRQVNGIRQRIIEGNISQIDPEAYRRISELLDAGDILTASEYVVLLANGQSIPGPAERCDQFKDEFFPGFVDSLQNYLGNRTAPTKDIPAEIGRREKVGPIDMRQVHDDQAKSAAEMLRSWQMLKSRRGQILEHLQLFLDRLGLSAVEVMRVVEDGRDTRQQVFDVSARVISDQDICLVPRYGSHAKGQYRVLCVWERPSEEEVLASAQARSGGRAVIVLYLGQLTVKQRRDLAFRSRERSQIVLVVDETLVYFLCSERGSRPATLFDCALPFTVAQTYVTTSSDVPPELFFGRRKEVENVFDQAGTNLVYGGRQLGKTALLREVVRRFHDPIRGAIVAWVDLKERHIGLSEPAAAVWQVIDRELVRQDVLPKARRGSEGTAEAITRWLDATPVRRIVMLLDEADAFLDQDARDADFKTVGTLKGLMERTGRRFKVVFAGLHNVQRTSRDVNTPLAHFGKPICIGPLLVNGEAREAFQLVERPLRQLGYRFDSPALVNRILAQTNYYPNLIQIYCAHLLNYLQDVGNARFDIATTPPYIINRDHVEAVSQSRDLQQTIRSQFQLTLDLDNRYQVVALSVALATQQREESGVGEADGFDPEWIRREAQAWWPQGFPDRSYDAFRALLDEMVGLGVLRRAGPELRGYALRSPAIAGLLGSTGEIEQALLEVSEKALPKLYRAASYRRGRLGDPWIRSPLTGQQESEVLAEKNGVLLLFGTVLAGLEWVVPFLLEMVKDKDFVKLTLIEGLQDLKGFETKLRKALDVSGKIDGTHLIVVPHTEPWKPAWVKLASEQIARRCSSRIYNRVLFVGGPGDAWHWLETGLADESSMLSTITLTQWAVPFVKQWAKDAGFGPLVNDDLDTWGMAIGWWGGLVAPLCERLKEAPSAWQRNFEIYRQQLPEILSGILSQDLPPDVEYPLQVFARYGEPLTEVDWLELLKGPDAKLDPEWLRLLIRWADLLNLLTPAEGGAWVINRVVGRALVG